MMADRPRRPVPLYDGAVTTAGVTTADDGAATERHDLPPPLVHVWRHPLRWTRNKAELVVAAVVLAHIGMLIVVSLYYLILELNPTVTHWWHSAVPQPNLRHSIRDVAEGVLGGFLAQGVVWNHYTRGHRKAGKRIDRLAEKTRVPVPLVALAGTVLFGVVGFVAGYYGLRALHAHAHTVVPHGNFFNRLSTIWRSAWDKKVVGYVVSLVARRPMFAVFDSVQRWFADRRVDMGKPLRWYHPPTFRARCHDLMAPDNPVQRHGWWENAAMLGAVFVGVCLAGYGFYVLTYVA